MKMKMWNRALIGLVAAALCCAAAGPSLGDAAQVRDLVAKHGKSVVTVLLVIKTSTSFGGQDAPKEESKTEATGTMVDASGLTAVSLSMISPADMVSSMMGDSKDFKVTSEITDVKIRYADGKEVPAKIVMRDKDLDLAFVRPSDKPDSPLDYVDLKTASTVDMGDQLVVLSRLGTAGDRQLSASIENVSSVVAKPRLFYVNSGQAMPGGAVYTSDGKLVGISLMRIPPKVPTGQGSFDFMSGMGTGMNLLIVTIPADQIATVAAQAPAK